MSLPIFREILQSLDDLLSFTILLFIKPIKTEYASLKVQFSSFVNSIFFHNVSRMNVPNIAVHRSCITMQQ
jgi:hypothetical protein